MGTMVRDFRHRRDVKPPSRNILKYINGFLNKHHYTQREFFLRRKYLKWKT